MYKNNLRYEDGILFFLHFIKNGAIYILLKALASWEGPLANACNGGTTEDLLLNDFSDISTFPCSQCLMIHFAYIYILSVHYMITAFPWITCIILC